MYANIRNAIISVLAAVLLSACVYQAGSSNPLSRKLTWYSYINADDIRNACEPGQPDAIRLVYNAIHTEQIRTYDITVPDNHNGKASLKARVLGPAYLSKLSEGPLGPWMDDTSTTHLRQEDVTRFWTALDHSGVFLPAPEGLHLVSEKFFWLTAVCRDGQFFYNAYQWPSDRFHKIQFDDLVFVWDMTGVPVNPPRNATMFDVYGDASPRKKYGAYYQVTIGKNGLEGY